MCDGAQIISIKFVKLIVNPSSWNGMKSATMVLVAFIYSILLSSNKWDTFSLILILLNLQISFFNLCILLESSKACSHLIYIYFLKFSIELSIVLCSYERLTTTHPTPTPSNLAKSQLSKSGYGDQNLYIV